MSDPEHTRSTNAANVEHILDLFDAKHDNLVAFCAKTKNLIEVCLQDANIRYQSVQSRVKTRKKLREKYLNPKKHYERLEDITDLAGLRIITYYEDEIDRVAEIIGREFEISPQHSVDKRKTEPDRFGYHALQYVCRHSEKRRADVEYKKFAEVCCEIQITSVLRHAWSEIEHEWYDLKDAYPDVIKRRFSRMAALLEIAESEFLDIRKQRSDYERSIAVQVQANVSDVQIDPVSLKSFIEQDAVLSRVDSKLSALLGIPVSAEVNEPSLQFRSTELRAAGFNTLQELRESLAQYEDAIVEYIARCREFWLRSHPLPPVLSKGVSVYHLAMLIVGSRSEEQLASLAYGAQVPGLVSAQANIAREIVGRAGGPFKHLFWA